MLINELLHIKYPIIQGGMTSISDGKFAASVSEAGGLGVIATGLWDKNRVKDEIHILKSLTNKPFGVNLYMMSPYIDELVDLMVEERVPVITTGAQSPEKYIQRLKASGSLIFPVVSSVSVAKRIAKFGVDGFIAEGMESGGHIGKATTMALLPQMIKEIHLPIIAAGGIATGSQLAACLQMGASGIQIGTVLIASNECPVHQNYKEAILKARDNDTTVILKNTGSPVRVLKNQLAREYKEMEKNNIYPEDIRNKEAEALQKGIFEGDINMGCLPLGQIAGIVKSIKPVKVILDDIIEEAISSIEALHDNIDKLNGGK